MNMNQKPFLAFFIFLGSSIAFSQSVDSLLVKQILIQGNETTMEHVILREKSLKVGDRMTQEALERDPDRIYSLQLFNKVEIQSVPHDDSTTLVVQVDERWYMFPFPVVGFRYRDVNKLYYGAGVMHQNFRGRNEKLFLSFALGYDRWVSLLYQNPKLTEDGDIFFRSAISYREVHNLNVSDVEYEQTNLATGLTVGKRYGLFQTLVGYLNYDVWMVSDLGLGRTASSSGRDAFFSLGLSYTYDSRNIREYPTEGMLFSVGATKAGFGESEVNLLSTGYDIRGYTLLSEEWSLAIRSFGTRVIGGVVPPYRRVFSGFDERNRGHFNERLEGESIVGESVELRFPLLNPRYFEAPIAIPQFKMLRYGLYAGFFVDAGKIWYRNESFSSKPWLMGYGAGLHFLLPYSIIVRTEYAWNELSHGQFVLDFGVSF